jgi:hypothetical protein
LFHVAKPTVDWTQYVVLVAVLTVNFEGTMAESYA